MYFCNFPHKTVILDCCHSGSGTREPELKPRGVSTPSGYSCPTPAQESAPESSAISPRSPPISPQGLESPIISPECPVIPLETPAIRPESPSISLEPKTPRKNYAIWGSASHVLLAACSAEQPSNESVAGGLFTRMLIGALRRDGAHDLTYRRLIEELPEVKQYVSKVNDLGEYARADGIFMTYSQQPQCEGVYVDRYLFTSISHTPEHDFHKLKRRPDTYSVEFNGQFKAQKGERYNVYAAQNNVDPPVFEVSVNSTSESTAELVPITKKKSEGSFDSPQCPLFLSSSILKRNG